MEEDLSLTTQEDQEEAKFQNLSSSLSKKASKERECSKAKKTQTWVSKPSIHSQRESISMLMNLSNKINSDKKQRRIHILKETEVLFISEAI